MSRPNNIKPECARKFLEDRGWALFNVRGTHYTYVINVDGANKYCQVIANYKTIHWKNAKQMFKKSGIPEAEWLKEC